MNFIAGIKRGEMRMCFKDFCLGLIAIPFWTVYLPLYLFKEFLIKFYNFICGVGIDLKDYKTLRDKILGRY